MEIDTEEKPIERWNDKLYKKIIDISDFIGSVLYKDRIITKEEILQKVFPISIKKTSNNKTFKTINMRDIFTNISEKIKPKSESDKKRTVGLIIFCGIILLCIIFIIYILNIIANIILDIMEWWILGIILLIFLLPISFAIAYILASDDY